MFKTTAFHKKSLSAKLEYPGSKAIKTPHNENGVKAKATLAKTGTAKTGSKGPMC